MMEGTPFDSGELLLWMNSGDVQLEGAACDIVMSENAVVHGELDPEGVEAFTIGYHVARIREAGKTVEPRIFNTLPYVAACDLALLYRQRFEEGQRGRAVPGLQRIRDELRKLYLEGDEAQKGCVVCGALEHIFEEAACRQDFRSWTFEPALAPAIEAAMEWADRAAVARSRRK
jgi:hypothetical protein